MLANRNTRRKRPSGQKRKTQVASLKQKATRETKVHPPQLNDYNITHSRTLRFTSVATATNTVISSANLLDLIIIAINATQGVDLFDIVKIKRVSIWSQAALGTPSTISLFFVNANTGDLSIHTDTSLGIQPAYVCASPSTKSLASFYSNSGTGPMFNISCPAGSVIDVHFTYKTSNNAPVLATSALVGASIGELYYRGLDGLPLASTNFPPPVGLLRQ